jgi:hypothetical protein
MAGALGMRSSSHTASARNLDFKWNKSKEVLKDLMAESLAAKRGHGHESECPLGFCYFLQLIADGYSRSTIVVANWW